MDINLIKGKNALCSIVIEQTKNYEKRMVYIPENNEFIESEQNSLFFVRKFDYPYGWIKESGNPPDRHLDIFLISDENYSLGDEVKIKVIGCFVRKDNDNKFVGIIPEREETTLKELPEKERTELFKLYPRIDEGEGWFGNDVANKLLEEWKVK